VGRSRGGGGTGKNEIRESPRGGERWFCSLRQYGRTQREHTPTEITFPWKKAKGRDPKKGNARNRHRAGGAGLEMKEGAGTGGARGVKGEA